MKLVIVNVAALSPYIMKRPDSGKFLFDFVSTGSFYPLEPVFPALTLPVQTSMLTGAYPEQHGIVCNGFYEREMSETHFWHQSAKLVQEERFWTSIKKSKKAFKVASLFWQLSKFSDADYIQTPAPIHTETGELLMASYSKPRALAKELEQQLGVFPLHRYWGPMTNVESTHWIANCTKYVLEKYAPHLTFTYLPLLDYSAQKFGPRSNQVLEDFKAVDAVLSEIFDAARKKGVAMVVCSEYSMSDVNGAIEINREFRKNDWISVREFKDREYLELADCHAFAVADHQIAHVYLSDLMNPQEVANFISSTWPEVEVLGSDSEKSELKINHERAGDLVLIAPPDKWFAYPYWTDDAKAPTFARTVDIHRKPGYDPLELFMDPKTKGIPFNTSLVKGSHGRIPTNEDEMGVIATSIPIDDIVKGDRVHATHMPEIIKFLWSSDL